MPKGEIVGLLTFSEWLVEPSMLALMSTGLALGIKATNVGIDEHAV